MQCTFSFRSSSDHTMMHDDLKNKKEVSCSNLSFELDDSMTAAVNHPLKKSVQDLRASGK